MATVRKSDKGLEKDKKKTPEKTWDGPHDNRKQEGAGTYPNQALVFHSRSGHNWTIDDSDGNESMTFQHRGGSAMQFLPNGAVQLVSHNSMYHLVFGQNRVSITGANDMHIKGDGSMLVYGDFNKTIHGNYNISATGDLNFTGENLNRMIRGNIETEAKNETKKLEGSSATTAHGAVAIAAKDSFTAVSAGDQVHIGSAKGTNLTSDQGNMTFNVEKGNFHFEGKEGTFEAKIKDAIKLLSDSGALHMIAQEAANILAKNGSVHINSQSGDVHLKADSGSHHFDAGQNINMQGGTSSQGGPQNAGGATGNAKEGAVPTANIDDSSSVGKLA
jgi:hypothetical protein